MACFGREAEAKNIWREFAVGRNLLMLAPRRVGKTVLLNHLQKTSEEQGYRAILLDVEGFVEEKDFFRECCATIQEELSTGKAVMAALTNKLKTIFSGSADSSDWRQILLQTEWKEFANHLFSHLNADDKGKPWVILIDELPIFVQALGRKSGQNSISEFLYWMRSVRQKYKNIRWLYTGSIGLDSVARKNNVEGALNDLRPITVLPFDIPIAKEFMKDIVGRRNLDISDDALNHVIDRLGWLSPYYLERIIEDACSDVAGLAVLDKHEMDVSMNKLLELGNRLYWASWREHIDRNFTDPDSTYLHNILRLASTYHAGIKQDNLLATINVSMEESERLAIKNCINTLISDGYIDRKEDGTLSFRMNLLREWWQRYVAM